MLRGFAITFTYLGALAAILFTAAGRVNWSMGWAVLGTYIATSIASLFLADPELVQERSEVRSGTQRRDMILAGASFLFFYPFTLVVAGVDIGRFGWSPSLPLVVQLLALVAFALGTGLGLWAVVSNRYFSTFVRIQNDRGQAVVRAGPYRYVRHPGYAGTVVAAIALPIALGSLWALLPATIGAGGFVVRTLLEDRTLVEELMGYREYASQVRHRLIPGIW
jgi:protein-S-isoprenylcysteine O-methyltransferase Ste14